MLMSLLERRKKSLIMTPLGEAAAMIAHFGHPTDFDIEREIIVLLCRSHEPEESIIFC